MRLPNGVGKKIVSVVSSVECQPDEEYAEAAREVLDVALSENHSRLTDAMMKTAWKRNFLG